QVGAAPGAPVRPVHPDGHRPASAAPAALRATTGPAAVGPAVLAPAAVVPGVVVPGVVVPRVVVPRVVVPRVVVHGVVVHGVVVHGVVVHGVVVHDDASRPGERELVHQGGVEPALLGQRPGVVVGRQHAVGPRDELGNTRGVRHPAVPFQSRL